MQILSSIKGEEGDFTSDQLMQMLKLAQNAASQLFAAQNKILIDF